MSHDKAALHDIIELFTLAIDYLGTSCGVTSALFRGTMLSS